MRLVAALLIHLFPRTLLDLLLRRAVSRGSYHFQPRFSGRVALFELASVFRLQSSAGTALLPDYICNLVPRAIAQAGWTVESYQTDGLLEASWSQIVARIDAGGVGLLVGASVFGSSGLLDDINRPENLEFLRERGVKVIADIAQDITLVDKLPENGADQVAAIVSFNDKSFPGLMGGGILAGRILASPERRLDAFELRALYRTAAVKELLPVLRWLRPRPPAKRGPFDYSFCRSFPFIIQDDYRPAKLQLAFGLLGLWSLSSFRAHKRPLLSQAAHLPTRYASSAAYLILSGPLTSAPAIARSRRLKAPYALERQPDASLRPDDATAYNRGFRDEA